MDKPYQNLSFDRGGQVTRVITQPFELIWLQDLHMHTTHSSFFYSTAGSTSNIDVIDLTQDSDAETSMNTGSTPTSSDDSSTDSDESLR